MLGTMSSYSEGRSFRHLFSGLELKMSRSLSIHRGNESQTGVVFAPHRKLSLEKKVDCRNATSDHGMISSRLII